jgi:DNA helicase HerA-like ATPase
MIDYEQLGRFYLGRVYDPETPPERRTPVLYDASDLTTHAVCVGMTGSGKTGLCLGVLEEAALDGIPTIAIDPKGDVADLALTFPELRPADFRPWIDEREAARRGITPDALAAETATRWRAGLAEWGQGPDRIRRLRDAAEVRIYTPGSDAGLPLAVVQSFEPPSGVAAGDAAATRERIASLVSGLLSLVGIEADPIRSREHVLLSTLIAQAWAAGRAAGLEALVGLVQRPPLERIGVVDVDTFFPPADRVELAMRLNALLAAPGFANWLRGDPLDAAGLLYGPDGRPRVSVISIAHLADHERMFVVTLVLGAVVAWMRRQPGSTSLRAILYLDEVAGFLPPVAAPPSKAPLLTMLKQARAQGLGVMLATQNPVDLDYKALGNAGTWLVGRLQTARDRERLLDGLTGAGGAGERLDRRAVADLLAGLERRVFLLHDVHEDAPVLMESRWALSFLRGPLTSAEIRRVSGAPAAPAAVVEAAAAPRDAAPAARAVLEPGIEEVFLAPAPGASGCRYDPALLATVRLHFVRASAGLDVWRTERAVVPLDPDGAPQWDVAAASSAPEEEEPRPGWALAPAPGSVTRRDSYRAWRRAAAAHFRRTARETLWTCDAPAATSASGESEAEFRARLAALTRAARDHEMERLRARYAPKLASFEERIRSAEARVDRESAQYEHQRTQTVISIGTTVLTALFGRKRGSATTVGRAGTAARAASRAARERGDIARARERVEDHRAALAALDAELEGSLGALRAPIDPRSFALAPLAITPRKSDVSVERLVLAWVPR